MGSAETKLAKELVSVLLELFVPSAIARKALGAPIGYLIEGAEGKKAAKTIDGIALGIAAELSALPDQDNPGSARSAAYDVVDILRNSKLGPELLIELGLDEQRVYTHFMAVGAPVLTTASQQRQGFIKLGLRKLADGVVECSPDLPGVRLAFMKAMLRSRNDRADEV